MRVKLGALVGASLLALATCVGVTAGSERTVSAAERELQTVNDANSLVLQLDRMASDLKVQGLQAIARPDPATQQSLLAQQLDSVQDGLEALRALALPPALDTARTRIETVYADYTGVIESFVRGAAADQAQARLSWEQIDADNYLARAVLENERGLFADSVRRAADRAADSRSSAAHVLWTTSGVAALVLVLLAYAIVTSVTRPLQRVRRSLAAMAVGDLTVPAQVSSRDEVGEMADALDQAQSSMRALIGSVAESAASVAAAAEEISATVRGMAGTARSSSGQAQAVSLAADQVSQSVQTVAKGAEEMSAAIGEIAHNANEAARVAGHAVTVAEETTGQMGKLGDSSRQIGDVVKLITSIAEQTKLLALNATIEAARAGEAGKGFAVVASEVKELAQETARATEEIGHRVEAIQADTEGAAVAIGEISSVVAQINGYQGGIASAVEEQTAVTAEMNRSVVEAAEGAGGIASNIAGLASAADVTTQSVAQSEEAVAELSRMAQDLHQLVASFRY
ncbi:methyl-accepting chemotaxis protein [Motilibacter aurantiacus]|uniref:methyl-accepting chemotaxis protein n=1 Tax=Motilibacter aurantiacus TaxID=2714955 RepID=UPI002F2B4E90